MIGTMLIQAIPRTSHEGTDRDLLLLACEARTGRVRLSRLGPEEGKARLLWGGKALASGRSVLAALTLPGGRIALLTAKAGRATYRTLRAKDGAALDAPIAVPPDASDLALVAGHTTLATNRGLEPVRAVPRTARITSPDAGGTFTFAGVLTHRGAAYAFATGGGWDVSSGSLIAYTTSKGRLVQTYRRDFAPGGSALVLSGNRLVVPLTDGQVQVYNVADPARPRLAGQFYLGRSWIAFATSSDARCFYALDRGGTLQAYRFDQEKGIVTVSNTVAGSPTDAARLFATSYGVVVCGAGTVRLYRLSGSTLVLALGLKVGDGPVFVLGSPDSPRHCRTRPEPPPSAMVDLRHTTSGP